MTATPPKWMLIRHELYQSLVGKVAGQEEEEASEVSTAEPAETAEKVATAEEVASAPEEVQEEVQPRSRTLRALQMMLANNESIAWPGDDLTLYGQSTGQSAAKVLTALNRSTVRADVAQKIILLILSKTSWTRAEYLAGGLGNVWKKVVKFRRDNRGSVARASRQNAVAKRNPAKLQSASR